MPRPTGLYVPTIQYPPSTVYTAPSNGANLASVCEELAKNVEDCEVEVRAQAKIVVKSKGNVRGVVGPVFGK